MGILRWNPVTDSITFVMMKFISLALCLLFFGLPLLEACWSHGSQSKPGNDQETCDIGAGVESGQMDDKDVEEASGLAYSRNQAGILYTIVDKGGPAIVFALNEAGDKVADLNLDGIENTDFEDIATTVIDGESFILVSDTGNNDHDRDPLNIFKFKEPETAEDMTVPQDSIEQFEVRYEGFSYDCEALAVDESTGDWFMFTKDRENSISEVYRYPFPQSVDNNPFTLEHVATLPLFWITGADISPDGQTLVLTNKEEAYKYDKIAEQSWTEFLTSHPEPSCLLKLEEEEQREAIAITENGIWTTSECKDDPPCPLWFYSISA